MLPISSKIFHDHWLTVVNKRKGNLLKIWRTASDFTSYIKGSEDCVLKEVSELLGLKYKNEYYSIDTVFYSEEDLVPNIPEGSTWLKNIQIAFEHENFFNSGLYKEIAHLLIVNCRLKVLVTYYPQGDYETELDTLHTIIKTSTDSKKISDNESFLIIIGDEKNFKWDGYSYHEDDWKLL